MALAPEAAVPAVPAAFPSTAAAPASTGCVHVRQSRVWGRTRQACINLAFVAMFGAFAIKTLLGIASSIFGIFSGVVCILFKIVPLCVLIFFWFKISGKKTSKSECGWRLGCFKQFVRSRFKKMGCTNPGAGCCSRERPQANAADHAVPSAANERALLISRIVGMGFDAQSAETALSQANYELAGALQILLSVRN